MDFFNNRYWGTNKNRKEDSPNERHPNHIVPSEDEAAPIVVIYQSELDYISRCILEYPNIETGGQLFGFWTDKGIPVVLYAIGPGENANHQSAFFNQDIDYLKIIGRKLIDRFGIQHIGEWHSHHQLGLARPSSHDANSILIGMDSAHLRRFLLCIGNCDPRTSTINAYTFHETTKANYYHAAWEIKKGISPFRMVFDEEYPELVHVPKVKTPSISNLKINGNTSSPQKEKIYQESYWLNDKQNNMQLKLIMDYLLEKANVLSVKPQVSEDKLVNLNVEKVDGSLNILFPMGFPNTPPTLTDDQYPALDLKWEAEDRVIKEVFEEYYEQYELLTKQNEEPINNQSITL